MKCQLESRETNWDFALIIKLYQWAEDGERKVVARKTSVYGNAFRCCCTVVVKGIDYFTKCWHGSLRNMENIS